MIFVGRFTALWPICGPTGQSSAFLTALGEASPLLELRAVRNLDDFGLSYLQIGHRALTAQKMSFKLTLTNTYITLTSH